MGTSIYRGFSTEANFDKRGKSFLVLDIEAIKRDLHNHIYTIPGERVMFPDFGTRIPLMAFEPLDSISIKIIEDDLRKVFNYDPRVRLVDLAVLPISDHNAIVALCDIEYIEIQVFETLRLEFATA